ncbi:hypothetical protein BEWA_014790 [Theileria equi strain WA]|uniref:RanBP2-type domain-containing protein n=1 Tax=Theileria equi strain WA TaxID=1537102 RepID=L1LCE3_THEEQ|nr:hypothetical protein BEWA_014790 [Theileria equi strain WA]EKX72920.1 hypothetical protein BEWA_014790 [Theileria equi strain WA]|eukprot:XP_004832372.1 hypothetical protein BEWA_014790 [Theileria equi strain WA]
MEWTPTLRREQISMFEHIKSGLITGPTLENDRFLWDSNVPFFETRNEILQLISEIYRYNFDSDEFSLMVKEVINRLEELKDKISFNACQSEYDASHIYSLRNIRSKSSAVNDVKAMLEIFLQYSSVIFDASLSQEKKNKHVLSGLTGLIRVLKRYNNKKVENIKIPISFVSAKNIPHDTYTAFNSIRTQVFELLMDIQFDLTYNENHYFCFKKVEEIFRENLEKFEYNPNEFIESDVKNDFNPIFHPLTKLFHEIGVLPNEVKDEDYIDVHIDTQGVTFVPLISKQKCLNLMKTVYDASIIVNYIIERMLIANSVEMKILISRGARIGTEIVQIHKETLVSILYDIELNDKLFENAEEIKVEVPTDQEEKRYKNIVFSSKTIEIPKKIFDSELSSYYSDPEIIPKFVNFENKLESTFKDLESSKPIVPRCETKKRPIGITRQAFLDLVNKFEKNKTRVKDVKVGTKSTKSKEKSAVKYPKIQLVKLIHKLHLFKKELGSSENAIIWAKTVTRKLLYETTRDAFNSGITEPLDINNEKVEHIVKRMDSFDISTRYSRESLIKYLINVIQKTTDKIRENIQINKSAILSLPTQKLIHELYMEMECFNRDVYNNDEIEKCAKCQVISTERASTGNYNNIVKKVNEKNTKEIESNEQVSEKNELEEQSYRSKKTMFEENIFKNSEYDEKDYESSDEESIICPAVPRKANQNIEECEKTFVTKTSCEKDLYTYHDYTMENYTRDEFAEHDRILAEILDEMSDCTYDPFAYLFSGERCQPKKNGDVNEINVELDVHSRRSTSAELIVSEPQVQKVEVHGFDSDIEDKSQEEEIECEIVKHMITDFIPWTFEYILGVEPKDNLVELCMQNQKFHKLYRILVLSEYQRLSTSGDEIKCCYEPPQWYKDIRENHQNTYSKLLAILEDTSNYSIYPSGSDSEYYESLAFHLSPEDLKVYEEDTYYDNSTIQPCGVDGEDVIDCSKLGSDRSKTFRSEYIDGRDPDFEEIYKFSIASTHKKLQMLIECAEKIQREKARKLDDTENQSVELDSISNLIYEPLKTIEEESMEDFSSEGSLMSESEAINIDPIDKSVSYQERNDIFDSKYEPENTIDIGDPQKSNLVGLIENNIECVDHSNKDKRKEDNTYKLELEPCTKSEGIKSDIEPVEEYLQESGIAVNFDKTQHSSEIVPNDTKESGPSTEIIETPEDESIESIKSLSSENPMPNIQYIELPYEFYTGNGLISFQYQQYSPELIGDNKVVDQNPSFYPTHPPNIVCTRTMPPLNYVYPKNSQYDKVLVMLGYITKNGFSLAGNLALLKIKFCGYKQCLKLISIDGDLDSNLTLGVVDDELEKIHNEHTYVPDAISEFRVTVNYPHMVWSLCPKRIFITLLEDKSAIYLPVMPNTKFKNEIDVLNGMENVEPDVKEYILNGLLKPLNFAVNPIDMPESVKRGEISNKLIQKFCRTLVGFIKHITCVSPPDVEFIDKCINEPGYYDSDHLKSWVSSALLSITKCMKHSMFTVQPYMSFYYNNDYKHKPFTAIFNARHMEELLRTNEAYYAHPYFKLENKTTKKDNIYYQFSDFEENNVINIMIDKPNESSKQDDPKREQTKNKIYKKSEHKKNVYKPYEPKITGNIQKRYKHPTEFQNPSDFLNLYGDPLCSTLLNPPTNMDINVNGNWECINCKNINFPRRTRCNRCHEIRDHDGDKVVLNYALELYQQYTDEIDPNTSVLREINQLCDEEKVINSPNSERGIKPSAANSKKVLSFSKSPSFAEITRMNRDNVRVIGVFSGTHGRTKGEIDFYPNKRFQKANLCSNSVGIGVYNIRHEPVRIKDARFVEAAPWRIINNKTPREGSYRESRSSKREPRQNREKHNNSKNNRRKEYEGIKNDFTI